MGCDRRLLTTYWRRLAFQLTHPRGVRLAAALKVNPCNFNSRTRVGCDFHNRRNNDRDKYFNSRTRVGCDVKIPVRDTEVEVISTHAPAWGATKRLKLFWRKLIISTHAPAWGATVPIAGVHYLISAFQLTHPRGVRRSLVMVSS